jgi:NADPH:quinone reductase-like Zn-dependent oxidoreductase
VPDAIVQVMTKTMRAAVCVRAGGPEVLEVREVPVPEARDGWSLVRVQGAGLNRSELRTRQGHSPGVRFPRVLGIECVGVVEETGTTVAAVMGEMGRDFDGGYAEYALLPDDLLMPITTTLRWEVLAALPESFLTAYGALDALGAGPGDRLLIRGGTSSVGLAAAAIARSRGIEVTATSRRTEPAEIGTPSHVLDLVGTDTVVDSLRRVRRGGTVCVAGSLSGWLLREFEPIAMIPSGTRLTAFHSNDIRGRAGAAVLQRIVDDVEAGVYGPNLDRVFGLDDVVAAHRYMEENRANGKVVLLP